MKDATKQIHIAAQYLAMAGKNYVEHKNDDSHTNLGWNDASKSYVSRQLANGDSIELDTCAMTLDWSGKNGGTLELSGIRHETVLQWMDRIAKSKGLNNFVFDLHYDIGHKDLDNNFTFKQINNQDCVYLAKLRTMAYRSCEQVLNELGYESDVRTWPHHFDTGAFVEVPDSEVSIGFGMAIPDSLSSDHYLYTSGYKARNGLNTNGYPALTKGDWKSGDWKGALLSVNGLSRSDFELFFKESISAFIAFAKTD